MIRYFLIFLLNAPLFVLAQTEDAYKPVYSTILDASYGKDLMKLPSRETPKAKNFWSVTQTDIDAVEQNFNKILALKSTGCCMKGVYITNLRNYGYQYLGISIDKKDYIYINAFELLAGQTIDQRYKTWKTEPVKWSDGGKMFWGVLFDPETSEFKQLSINGRK